MFSSSPHLSPAQHELRASVLDVVRATPTRDIHTHLYAPHFHNLLLYGIDELLVFHYLVAEGFRGFARDLSYEAFWNLPKTAQAELIWEQLFVQNSPLSEAARGLVTTLNQLGIEPRSRDLPALRRWFARWDADQYTDHCLKLANVSRLCMTNSPFDDEERIAWDTYRGDSRFDAALRIDPLLMDWEGAGKRLCEWGYDVTPDLSGQTFAEVRRFLADWTRRMNPLFVMVSLPPEFAFPEDSACGRLIAHAVLPHCQEFGLPFSPMLGVKKLVNPALRLAGDSVGRSDLDALLNLCAQFPDNKFLVTVLARENQHELCVLARKFRNLHLFGCWWFSNIPSVIDEMTRMRLDLLGPTFTAQHSDARVLEQIIYKWNHSREVIGGVLADRYCDLSLAGWTASRPEIERDVRALLGGEFERFCAA